MAGKEEAQHGRCQLSVGPTRAVETASRLSEQIRLSAVGSTIAINMLNPYHAGISEAAKGILNAATQTSVQSLVGSLGSIDSFALARDASHPVINAVAGLGLLASTEDAVRSLANVVASVDSLKLTEGSIQSLKNTVAGVQLMTSAQDAMQSLTSVAARFTSSVLTEYPIQPLLSAAAGYDSLVSAQDAIRPLIDATARFDSLVLSEKTIQPFPALGTADYSLSVAQKAVQPLINAATRFDSITFGQEAMQPLVGAVGRVDSLTSFQERFGVVASVTANSLFGASALEIAGSAPFASALDAIKSISLKPTLVEVAASQSVRVMGDYSQSILADLYPRLTGEAMTAFSQSQRISLASVEQLSVLGGSNSNLLKEYRTASFELGDIMSDLGVISAQEHIKASWVAMMPSVAEVGRTYRGLLADAVGGLNKSVIDNIMDGGIAIPTIATSAYIRSVKTAMVADETDDEDAGSQGAFRAARMDRASQLDIVFQGLGPNFTAMWEGSWAVLDSKSPDRIRQAAHSGRELLMQMLAKLAPNSVFDVAEIEKYGCKGKPTRIMRVKKILGSDNKSAVGWVDSMARALEETYDRLTAVSHERNLHPHVTEQELTGLLYALGGLGKFIDAFQHRNRDDG